MIAKTNYLGLNLTSPIIAGSSGLTDNIEKLIELEKSGAGAIVIKSLFEEEIIQEMNTSHDQSLENGLTFPETLDMFDRVSDTNSVFDYLEFIKEAKNKLSIPIIASINCLSSQKWTYFAKKIEEAGADALELNIFQMPSDFDRPNSYDLEKIYFDIINTVLPQISIPVALKPSFYFSNLGPILQQFSQTGVKGLVLFNRFFSPDYDIDKLEVIPTNILSSPSDLAISLRWIAIMHQRVNCDLCASTGIHNGQAVIKEILAGANAVQIA